ncbi:MAG: sigma-54-dependent Fis family transcriptional regulator [Myxococcales bacterium]|nr:sigma-54-dependent Fis family transcriptional regulator [Myxococcales bacterium]
MKRDAEPSGSLPALALTEAAGAALVLDRELSVVLATESAERLLGPVKLGVSAPKLLCAEGAKRPIAEALVAGRSVRAVIPKPRPADGERLLEVRSLPLRHDGELSGWLLLLEDAGPADEGAVEFHGMWARTASMKHVFHVIEQVAADDVTVLVRGETGSGKELVARALHTLSRRSAGPFRALNCAALPGNLLESELFGHVRGAFTGAVKDTPGHIQLAHGGTLFLDEIAEMPLDLQAKLLRVIETRSVIPVGAREPIPVDVRIVSATHRSLRAEVEAGRFRADLMYRLRVIPIFLPPLRERREDIVLIANQLIAQANEGARRRIERIAPAAEAVLTRYDWPGNVRELRNVLAYAYAIGKGPILLPSELPWELSEPKLEDRGEGSESIARRSGELDAEGQRILAVLERAGGSRSRAAKVLGMSRVTLWRRLKALGIEG